MYNNYISLDNLEPTIQNGGGLLTITCPHSVFRHMTKSTTGHRDYQFKEWSLFSFFVQYVIKLSPSKILVLNSVLFFKEIPYISVFPILFFSESKSN